MVVLPIFTMGLAAWVPAAWASTKVDDPQRKKALRRWAAGLAVAGVVSFSMIGNSSSTGASSDTQSNIGGFAMMGVIGVGTWLAIANRYVADRRHDLASLPGAREALAQRELRDRYRDIVARDPDLARNMNIGRPDLPRNYDDGGLLDINSASASALVEHGLLTPEEAEKTLAARERLGGLSSVDDLVLFGDVNPESAERLKERAVFL